jgi:hypothetical protein
MTKTSASRAQCPSHQPQLVCSAAPGEARARLLRPEDHVHPGEGSDHPCATAAPPLVPGEEGLIAEGDDPGPAPGPNLGLVAAGRFLNLKNIFF